MHMNDVISVSTPRSHAYNTYKLTYYIMYTQPQLKTHGYFLTDHSQRLGVDAGDTGVKGLLSRQNLNRTFYTSKEAQFNTEQSYIGAQNICLVIKKIYHFLTPSM